MKCVQRWSASGLLLWLAGFSFSALAQTPSSYWQAVTNASPVAYWRLNETNGATVAADLLGFHNGTISASVTPGVNGPQGPLFPGFETTNTSMQFNYTTGSYLTMPALNLDTNSVTICGWINPTGIQAAWTGIAFCRGGTTCAGLNFGPGSIANELRYTWNNSRWDQSTGLAVPAGQWSFFALVVTPTNATIYLGTNGVLSSYTDVASEPNQAFDPSLLIGYDPSEGSRLFRGVIDEVAVCNRALTSTQIQQIYTSALTLPALAPPSGLTATAVSSFEIDLSWTDNSDDEDGFKVERAPDNAGTPGTWTQIGTVSANITNFSETTLSPNTRYWYRVRAYGAGGNSDFSNSASSTTLLSSAPSNLMVSSTSFNQIKLSWKDNSNNESGFKVERSTDGTNFVQIAQVLPNTTSYRNSALWPNAIYYYRVRAYNSGGNLGCSNTVTERTPAAPCPLSIFAWGLNNFGQAIPPLGLTGIVAIAAGNYHSLVLKADGTVVGWGGSGSGEETPPAGLTGVAAIAAGGFHSLAVKTDGTVVAWGYNGWGEASVPTGLAGVVSVAAGDLHSLALKSDGTVVGWGLNNYGQAKPPIGLAGVVAIAAAGDRSLALMSDNTLVEWGDTNPQTPPPIGLPNVVGIAEGGWDHSLALLGDGTVVAWGGNSYGDTTIPSGATGVVAIAAGSYYSLALKSDGTIIGWGLNNYGQSTPPTGLSGVAAIACGGGHGLALTVVPNAPSNLTAAPVSGNEADLTWGDNSTSENGFIIQRAPDAGAGPGIWMQVGTVTAGSTSYRDTSVVTNTAYWYQVQSFDACGASPFSNSAFVDTAPPAMPSNLVAIAVSTNQVNLSWTDNSMGQARFAIERALDAGGSPGAWAQIAMVGVNVNTYRDTNVPPYSAYWYRVRAYDDLGYSPYLGAVFVSIIPLAPSALTATAVASNQINLTWEDNSTDEVGFSIERAPDGGGAPGTWMQIATVLSNITSYADAGLTTNTTYWYRVRAYNAVGNSDYCNIATATTLSLPTAPSDLVATSVSSSQIDLSWTDNSNNEFGFKIERAPDNGGAPGSWSQITTRGSNATNYSNNGLASGTIYWYRVRAYNEVGNSPYGNITNATTTGPPLAPSNLAASVISSNQVNLSWTDNSSTEDGFKIERSSSQNYFDYNITLTATVGSNVTAYSDTGVATNQTHWYRVRAYNSYGNSANTLIVGVSIPSLPGSPSSLTATAISSNQINLSWKDNASNEDGFKIERAPDIVGTPGTWTQIATVTTNVTSYSDVGLAGTTRYWYRVRTYNVSGDSPFSNTANASTAEGQNVWINPASDKWEVAPSWSQGVPSVAQSGLLITNANSKTVTIDAATVASNGVNNCMTIGGLTILAPAGDTNSLSMIDTGTNVLHVLNSLTITNGGEVIITNSALQVDGPLGIDGDLRLRPRAQVIATNAFTSIGFSVVATGQVTMTGGTATFLRLIVGSNTLSVGTFTVNGGNLVVTNMFVGLGSNSAGAAWISDSTFSAPSSVGVATVGRHATGQLTFSNSTARLPFLSLATSVDSQGTLTMVGSTITFSSSGVSGGQGTGTVLLCDGQLNITNGSLGIGVNDGVGQMTITNAVASASQLNVGVGNTQGQGTLTAIDSSLIISNFAVIGSGSNATGTLWLTSSQLQLLAATNWIFMPLANGAGRMILSNNSTVSVGTTSLGSGTLTIQNGGVSVFSNLFAGDSSYGTGTVWLSSGQITVSNGVMTMGRLTVSNGFVSVWDATVASTTASSAVDVADSAGILTIVEGSFSASSSLILGKCVSNALGQIIVSGGRLLVTNATHTAYLDLRGGTLTLSSGSVIVDQFVMTNVCAQLVRTGGTLIYGTAVLDPNLDADGDGIPNSWEQSHGLDPLDPSDANIDSDGDGFSNLQEYLAGTDPTNSASAFRITSVNSTGGDILVNWMTGIGRTNALQAAPNAFGATTNGFTDIFTVTNTVGTTTNYLDIGAATNVPSRFYRVRLVP